MEAPSSVKGLKHICKKEKILRFNKQCFCLRCDCVGRCWRLGCAGSGEAQLSRTCWFRAHGFGQGSTDSDMSRRSHQFLYLSCWYSPGWRSLQKELQPVCVHGMFDILGTSCNPLSFSHFSAKTLSVCRVIFCTPAKIRVLFVLKSRKLSSRKCHIQNNLLIVHKWCIGCFSSTFPAFTCLLVKCVVSSSKSS